MPYSQKHYEDTIQHTALEVSEHIRGVATELDVPPDTFARSVIAAMGDLYVGVQDTRAVGWRVRFRLYYAAKPDDHIYDSDATMPADAPGCKVIYGLPNVCSWISEQASTFHEKPCAGLDSKSLKHRLTTLRNQMSRRGNGYGVMRVYYSVMKQSFLGPDESKMLMRADIVKETEATEN